jgi:hypothetical protein
MDVFGRMICRRYRRVCRVQVIASKGAISMRASKPKMGGTAASGVAARLIEALVAENGGRDLAGVYSAHPRRPESSAIGQAYHAPSSSQRRAQDTERPTRDPTSEWRVPLCFGLVVLR